MRDQNKVDTKHQLQADDAASEKRARAWFSEFGPGDVGFAEMRDVVMAALQAQHGDASRSVDDSND
jgi:hypothetical protein